MSRAHSRQCFANHLAAQWAIEPAWAERMLAQVKAVGLPTLRAMDDDDVSGDAYDPMDAIREVRNGVAIISIDGPMAKFDSSMGGANTVRIRQAVRAAANDPTIGAIVMRADSPGGTVDGTKELADEVRAANALKPVYGFAEDMTASAAYWVMAQTRKLYANATALVGSIGVYTVLVDSSKAYELAGLKAIVVGSGGVKGLGADGTPITDDLIAYVQEIIDDRAKFFNAAVGEGRGMTPAAVKAVADGKVHVATKAKALGLIDGIRTLDEVVAEASSRAGGGRRPRASAAAAEIARAE
jgi:signal peptide peptidase SppA